MQNSQIKTHHLIKQSVFPSYRRNNLSASCVWTDADISVRCQRTLPMRVTPVETPAVSRLQLFDGHVCVTLRGLQRGMPQHLLHLPDRSAAFEQMRGERVSQQVGVHPLGDSGFLRRLFQLLRHDALRERLALVPLEQPFLRLVQLGVLGQLLTRGFDSSV